MYTMTTERKPVLVGDGAGKKVSADSESFSRNVSNDTYQMPSLHAFTTENGEIRPEDLSMALQSQVAMILGLFSGVLAGVFMCRHWLILLILLIAFTIFTVMWTSISDCFITSLLWCINSSYVNLRKNIRLDTKRPHVVKAL